MAIILYNSIKCISFPMTVKCTEIFKEGGIGLQKVLSSTIYLNCNYF